jgi:hypothetical protein
MSEIKIARFVDIEACKSIFSEHSTFVLRSPIYYQRMYEMSGGSGGDKKEGRPDTANGSAVSEGWLVSCWTILKGNKPSDEEWDKFKENESNIVAIISTPGKVCEFLNRVLKSDKLPFWPVECNNAIYDKEKVHVDSKNIISVVPLLKGKEFKEQDECRFVLRHGLTPHLIDSFIFCGGIGYMEKCYVNPKMRKEVLAELLSSVGNAAGHGDFTGKKLGDVYCSPLRNGAKYGRIS